MRREVLRANWVLCANVRCYVQPWKVLRAGATCNATPGVQRPGRLCFCGRAEEQMMQLCRERVQMMLSPRGDMSPVRPDPGRLQMRIVRRPLAVFLIALLVAPAAQAQTHVIGKSALGQAVQERVSQTQTDRDAILALLQRPEVREIAAKTGLSLDKAQAAVSMLEGEDLRDLASQARQVQNELAGGASTVVISTTTIILVLLIVILIILLD